MLKEAIEKIVSLATPETYKIGDDTYTTKNLTRVAPHIDRPESTRFKSLDAIVQAVKTEIQRVTLPVFISVSSHDKVDVFTTYRDDNMKRDSLYEANLERLDDVPRWMEHDEAVIALQSRFVQNDDSDYVLKILSQITDENSVQSVDNGISQTVNVKQGVSLQQKAAVKPRVNLKPFRTFLEVDQPESTFLLRLRPGNKERERPMSIGLFEADGGAWKLTAKRNIADYFREHLAELIEQDQVIVTE